MKVVVSACLLGENCKYSGGNNLCQRLVDWLAAHEDVEVIPVCPEVAGGLPTPRPPAEIVDGVVINNKGVSVDAEFRAGTATEIERLQSYIAAGEIECAILQSRSPSCGVREVYDGTFTGTLVPGRGLFAQALSEVGVHVIDVGDFDDSVCMGQF